jgi:hypothetical protein
MAPLRAYRRGDQRRFSKLFIDGAGIAGSLGMRLQASAGGLAVQPGGKPR